MAMNFYSHASSNPIDHHFGLGNEIIDGQFPSFRSSNTNMNHVNESSGLISSHLLPYSIPIATGFHQNDHLISQRISPAILGLGKVGFSRSSVTEVRRACATPHRVQIHSIIDYSPVQNHLALSSNEVLISHEVTKTIWFLTPSSTMERVFAPNYNVLNQGLAPNNGARALGLVSNVAAHLQGLIANDCVTTNQGQPNGRNQILFSSNQFNHSFTEIEPFQNPIQQNRTLNQQALNIIDLDDDHTGQTNRDLGVLLDPTPLSAYMSPTRRANHKTPDHDQNPRQISNPSPEQMDQNDEYDGRTHSLPCKKYGPYKCPKCKGVFHISQTFAAHMWSHYKYESGAERKRRLAARYKKKHLRLVYSTEGLTVMPHPSIKETIKVYRRKNGRRGMAESADGLKVEDDQLQLPQGLKDGSAKTAENAHGEVLCKVKEEAKEEKFHGDKIKKEPV